MQLQARSEPQRVSGMKQYNCVQCGVMEGIETNQPCACFGTVTCPTDMSKHDNNMLLIEWNVGQSALIMHQSFHVSCPGSFFIAFLFV